MPRLSAYDKIELEAIAREHTELAIQTLVGVLLSGKSEAAKVQAAQALLDRGWGKPYARPVPEIEAPEIKTIDGKAVRDELASRITGIAARISAPSSNGSTDSSRDN